MNDAVKAGFGTLIGVELADLGPDEARASIAVAEHHRQPQGVVHGGVYAALAETVASAATAAAVRDEGKVAFGMSNNATFLRPITEGRLQAVARPRQRGRTTWVWDVEISDDAGETCALARITIAVRPKRD